MALDDVLIQGRAAFGGLLTDTCRVTRAGVGAPVFNNTTGQYTHPTRATVYEGPCRIQVKVDINSNVVEATVGSREWTYLTAQLQVPVDTPAGAIGLVHEIDVDDIAEVLTAPYSESLVGAEFTIQGTYHKSHAVYTRYRVREVIG